MSVHGFSFEFRVTGERSSAEAVFADFQRFVEGRLSCPEGERFHVVSSKIARKNVLVATPSPL